MALSILISMVVSPDKTVNSCLCRVDGEGSPMGKDVFYRLKNSSSVCWRMLLWYLALRFLKVTSEEGCPGDDSPRYLEDVLFCHISEAPG